MNKYPPKNPALTGYEVDPSEAYRVARRPGLSPQEYGGPSQLYHDGDLNAILSAGAAGMHQAGQSRLRKMFDEAYGQGAFDEVMASDRAGYDFGYEAPVVSERQYQQARRGNIPYERGQGDPLIEELMRILEGR